MPSYLFKNKQTGFVSEYIIRMSDYDVFIESNPNLERIIEAPAIVSSSGGDLYSKTPDGFKEVLAKVAEAHPKSTVAERFGKSSIKQSRTKEIVKKHRKKFRDRLLES